jgi:hypothetical protein
MAKASHFPPGNAVSRQRRRKNQVYYIRFCGTKTSRSGHYGDVFLVPEKQQIAWLNGSEKALNLTAALQKSPAHYIVGAGRSRGGRDQNYGSAKTKEPIDGAREALFTFHNGNLVSRFDAEMLQTLEHHTFEHLPGALAL